MLTDITTNIFNNVINFITGQNAQDRFVNLLDSSPNILSDKDQANGYVGLDAVGNMFSSYYNENISRANLVTLLTSSTAVGYKYYQIYDADGANYRTLLVMADSNITLYPWAIDLNTSEVGTYNITTDTFVSTLGGIVTTTEAALAALETAGTLSTTVLYMVTDSSPYKLLCKAETASQLSRTAQIVDAVYSGSVDYDVQSGAMYGIAISDGGNKPNQYFGVNPSAWSLGIDCTTNKFYSRSSGSLGDNCVNNTFEQEASGTLGESCVNNTFKQLASGFTFGINLQNVTIEAGTAGADYSASPTYDFLYNNTYPATIFSDGTDNYHRYYDVANDQIVITLLSSPFTVSYIGGGGGGITSVQAGTNISVDNTNPASPIINSLADRYKTASTTSNTISNGSKTFTVDADLAYIPLQEVLIVFDPSNHMHGSVTAYNSTTGQLDVDIDQHTGSGTYTSWVINLDGTPIDAITGTGTLNRLAYFTAAQVIDDVAAITASRALKSDANGLPVHFDTATEPSLTELSYVKGVTSAIQTQINNAQTLSIECIAGTITSPVDLATYYWCIGGTFLTASTSVTGQGSKFAYAFEITGITIRMTTTTAGSAEDSTLYLRNITTSTSTLMGTFKTNGNLAYTSITGLAISCNTTDEYCLEMRSPTWATNPLNLRLTASLFLRRT